MGLIQISDSEFEVMKVIWDNYPISTNGIVDLVGKNSKWNMRTIHTLIARLEKKGAISHTKDKRIYVYSPLIKKEDYIHEESMTFLNRFFNGAINKMVMNFIENDMLSQEDLDELKNILNKKG